MRVILLAAASCLALAACSPNGTSPSDKPAAAAAAKAAGKRFFDREAFTIVYTLSGTQTGTKTEHIRDWGDRRATLENSSIAVMGVRTQTKNRTIMEGPTLFQVDELSGGVTQMDNPIYGAITADMAGKSGVEYGKALMTKMGGTLTAETGKFAGETCQYWTIMGRRTCITDWGGTLHQVTSVGGIRVEQTATEVRLGDGGPDSAFAVDKSKAKVVAIPDLSMEDVAGAAKDGEAMLKKLEGLKLPGRE